MGMFAQLSSTGNSNLATGSGTTSQAASVGLQQPTLYKHPSEMSAANIVRITNALGDAKFKKPNGKPNIRKISDHVQEHYFTVKRFIEGAYKKPDEFRADKGRMRKFKNSQLQKLVKETFVKWFTANAQQNVAYATYKTELETGYKIPVHIAYEWGRTLSGAHDFKHYYKTFIKKHTPHLHIDNWGEVENFLDVVITDVNKIDDPFIPETERGKINLELDALRKTNKKKWETQRTKAATAYQLTFIDRKTRFPLLTVVCPHSVSGSDVKKGMMRVIKKWGLPKKWYLDNGREFVNEETIQFLYGVYSGEMEWNQSCTNLQVVELCEQGTTEFSIPYQPYGKGTQERQYRIIKDEHFAFSPSYSPNQVESRKPSLQLSAVQPEKFFEELAKDLDEFIYGDFLTRPREMFLHPGYTATHEINLNRPKTILEAFNTAYQTYEPAVVDEFLLAYHYADKRMKTFREGCIEFTYKKIKLQYIPEDPALLREYSFVKEAITVLMDPQQIYHCWLFDGKKLLCEAKDIRYETNIGISKDRASYIDKLRTKAIRAQRSYNRLIGEIDNVHSARLEESNIQDFGIVIDNGTDEDININNLNDYVGNGRDRSALEPAMIDEFDIYSED